ncbi:hypothetical protein LBMAG21_02800 [Armatimonadota bacterium]|nr:hypothetical protein LBMAG21_02800 [Armatimonadota bacterium]
MWQRFTERARRVVFFAQEEAGRLGENYVSTEHLLLGLIKERDSVAARILDRMGVSLARIWSEIERSVTPGKGRQGQDMQLTPRAKQVIDLAYDEARLLTNDYIGTEHLLLGLIREGGGLAGRVLAKLGITLERTRAEVLALMESHGSAYASKTPPPKQDTPRESLPWLYDKAVATTKPKIHVIDSHTGGEPTRLVVSGAPDLGTGSLPAQLTLFRDRYDQFRSAIVNEPRGSEAMVGALLVAATTEECVTGVLFFNNVGFLGMCGHGMIGVVTTLAYLNFITPDEHKIETPVGVVSVVLHESGEVSVTNVPSYRYRESVSVEVEGIGTVTGDIAYGGNWFYLVEGHRQELTMQNIEGLTDFTWRIRQALAANGITGAGGQEVDHIELFAPSPTEGVNSRNFVLCPGKAYDRSPCGTGTSAKLACLVADGKLQPGEVWKQESVTGSLFEGSVAIVDGQIIPTIKGRAHINGEAFLLLDPADPLCWGIRGE